MNLHKNILIDLNSTTDRAHLLNLQRDEILGSNVHVVYIYSLEGKSIEYPEKPGCVIYIGEAFRRSEPTGKRFSQHISTGITVGGDTGTIYSLSRYYWKGQTIRLRIFILNENENRKTIERNLLKAHVKKFGALPICQGTTGSNYKTTHLNELEFTNEFNILTD